MEVTTINAELFARMFLAGANNLEAKKEWINELNVYVNDNYVSSKGSCSD